MKNLISILTLAASLCSAPNSAFAQGLSVNSTGTSADASAMLDVASTSKGMLVPRMTQAQVDSISNPATGLLVFQTDGTAGFYYNNGTSIAPSWIQLGADKPATYRWATFSSYDQACCWIMGNTASLFGGVTPSSWTDGGALAGDIDSDKEVLRTLFTQKGYAKANAMVFSDTWYYYSSTNGKIVATLFRIKNSTSSSITWTPYFYYSAYSGWGEMASVALNGVTQASYSSSGNTSIALSIPANRTSTVIFVSASDLPSGTRTVQLGFYNNCLTLPNGLSFIDDLDTATGGWSQ